MALPPLAVLLAVTSKPRVLPELACTVMQNATSGINYGGYFRSNSSAGIAVLAQAGNAATKGIVVPAATSQTGNLIEFRNSASTVIGSVTISGGTNVAYNTSSDRRLKENIKPTIAGLDDLLKIKVRDYTLINDPTKTRVQGYIAQELKEVYPEAVKVGGDDAKKDPWAVDYGRVTPLLVRAVQELKALFDDLVAKCEGHDKLIAALTKRLDAQDAEIAPLKKALEAKAH